MAEIQDWIKEQLKKGYKKEQIKEGLRKAGYQQDTIDSVDNYSKPKKTKIFIFLFAAVIILIILFFIYLKNQETNNQDENLKTNPYYTELSKPYPDNEDENDDFVSQCKAASNFEGIKEKDILLCKAVKTDSGKYIPGACLDLDGASIKEGNYIGIIFDVEKMVEDKYPELSFDESYDVCFTTEPSLNMPYENYFITNERIFPEGMILCKKIYPPEEGYVENYFTGFVKESDYLNINAYAVPEDKVKEIVSKDSFSDSKNSLEDYKKLINLELPIIK